MKIIMEYNLPEEEEQYIDSFYGSRWRNVSREFFRIVRDKIKYETNDKKIDRLLNDIKDKMCSILEENKLSLYE